VQVVDMFGAGLPVCAVDYACISELVQPGRTGLLFASAKELSLQLQRLLAGFGAGAGQLPSGCAVKKLRPLRHGDRWASVRHVCASYVLPPACTWRVLCQAHAVLCCMPDPTPTPPPVLAGPAEGGELAALRRGVLEEQGSWRWADNWDGVAGPLFAAAASGQALPVPQVAPPAAGAPAGKARQQGREGVVSPRRQRAGSGRRRGAA
jgi:hypothetical protein